MRMYQNPLIVRTDDQEQLSSVREAASYNPDPYVLKWNGEYYAYATSEAGVSIMMSKDMVSWTHRGYAYQEEGRSGYWAPAVFYDNGLFYLYVSNMPSDSDDVHLQFMRVAVANTPEGPFDYVTTLFDTFSIDAHVVRDSDGALILFYSTNETYGIDAHRAGTVILADRLVDPFTLEGQPRLVVRPTLDEEVFAENRFGDGRDWHTIEGAFHLKRGCKHYVMYSGNAYTSPYYYVGYSTAEHKAGQSIAELAWTKYPDEDTYEPLLRQSAKVEGVGHNSVSKAPNNVDDWIVYHGREVRAEGRSDEGERRQMRMDPLLWSGDRMSVPGPTCEESPAPAMPSFRDLFDRQDTEAGEGIGSGWTTDGGQWRLSGGELLQSGLVGIGRAFIVASHSHALFELNVRWERSHMGGLYGAALLTGDGIVEVLFDVGKRTLGHCETVRGVRLEEKVASLPRGFRFDAYHQLLVRTAGESIRVELDGVEVLRGRCSSPISRYGLAAHYTSASFDGIALTGSLSFLEAGSAACLAECSVLSGDWSAQGSALVGVPLSGVAGLTISNLFREGATSCRFDLDERGIGAEAPSCFSIDLAFGGPDDGGRSVVLGADALAGGNTLHIRHEGGRLSVWAGARLAISEPADDAWHSLTVSAGRKLAIRNLEWTALGI